MINILNYDINYYLIISVKLLLAIVMGGFIGLERLKKRRPAGIKTHALVCLGSALVMITGEYISLVYNTTDIARLGAQVVSGVGFLGAGTIMVTRNNRISGLTTAAGLWLSACVGLAIGIGNYAATFISLLMVIIVRILFGKVDTYYKKHSNIAEFHILLDDKNKLLDVLENIKATNAIITNIEIINDSLNSYILTVTYDKYFNHQEFEKNLLTYKGVIIVQEVHG